MLRDCVAVAGVDPAVVERALGDDALGRELNAAQAAAERAGVQGVPTFVYDDRAVSGAVPAYDLRYLVSLAD